MSDEILFCPGCGAKLTSNINFCYKCGTNVSNYINQMKDSETIKCPSCGSLNPLDTPACLKCWAKIDLEPSTKEDTRTEVKETRKVTYSVSYEESEKIKENSQLTKELANKNPNVSKIILYSLSSCIWSNKTKELLRKLKVDFDFIDVDLLPVEHKQKKLEELKKYNSNLSFPTLVIYDKKVIVGFKEEELKNIFIT